MASPPFHQPWDLNQQNIADKTNDQRWGTVIALPLLPLHGLSGLCAYSPSGDRDPRSALPGLRQTGQIPVLTLTLKATLSLVSASSEWDNNPLERTYHYLHVHFQEVAPSAPTALGTCAVEGPGAQPQTGPVKKQRALHASGGSIALVHGLCSKMTQALSPRGGKEDTPRSVANGE